MYWCNKFLIVELLLSFWGIIRKEIKMATVEPIRNLEDLRKVEKILKKQSSRDLLLFTIGTNCGLRISDILALDIKDIKGKNYIQIVEKKTKKYKKFPINSKLKPMLDDYVKDKNCDEPLFQSIYHNRLERFAAYHIIKKACSKAGLEERIGTHTLRKTFGYHHYKKYKDVAMLQKIFNHSSPQITLRYIGIEQDQINESYANFIL